MKKIRLQVFDNVCEKCGAKFDSLHSSPHDYGFILFSTPLLETVFSFPDSSPVWDELESLTSRIAQENKLSSSEEVDLFGALLANSVDRSPSGSPYYAWGRFPCPTCGGFSRSFLGPKEPPRFVNVDMTEARHTLWLSLSEEERHREIRKIAFEYMKRIGRSF